MWRNVKKCLYRNKEIDEECIRKSNVQSQAQMLLHPYKSYGSTDIQVVIRQMQLDEITEVVREDSLITTYRKFLLSGKGFKNSNYISQHMAFSGNCFSP